jgi:hypothetical protein
MPPFRPGDDGGPTITEKIAARKAAGGAEAWDEWKARVAKQQNEQHAIENHELLLAAAHREMLDREREARLHRAAPENERSRKAKRRERDASASSSDDDGDDSDGSDRKRRRKSDKEKKKKEKKEKRRKEKKEKKSSHKEHKRDKKSKRETSADDKPRTSEPVPLSRFLAEQSDSDD